MGTSICHSVISQMINFFVVCCFVNPGSDPSSEPGSDPGSDPGFILSLSLQCNIDICTVFNSFGHMYILFNSVREKFCWGS